MHTQTYIHTYLSIHRRIYTHTYAQAMLDSVLAIKNAEHIERHISIQTYIHTYLSIHRRIYTHTYAQAMLDSVLAIKNATERLNTLRDIYPKLDNEGLSLVGMYVCLCECVFPCLCEYLFITMY